MMSGLKTTKTGFTCRTCIEFVTRDELAHDEWTQDRPYCLTCHELMTRPPPPPSNPPAPPSNPLLPFWPALSCTTCMCAKADACAAKQMHVGERTYKQHVAHLACAHLARAPKHKKHVHVRHSTNRSLSNGDAS